MAMLQRCVGQVSLPALESYTIPLPVSLQADAADMPCSMQTSVSRPLTLLGADKGTIGELTHAIAAALSKDFNIAVSTAAPAEVVRTGDGDSVKENVKRIVLIGASNLKRVVGVLVSEGYEVVDLCTPGWTITPQNVAELIVRVKPSVGASNVAYVLDLFGNSVFRATLFDGTTTMPIKGVGGYHLPGEVGLCSDEVFKKLIETVHPLLESLGGVGIILPPQPRYVFHPCCGDRSHCTNLGGPNHSEKIVSDTLHLRGVMKKQLSSALPGKFLVMDTCATVKGVGDKTAADRLPGLRAVMATDGVHVTPEGTKNLADEIVSVISDCSGNLRHHSCIAASAACNVSGAAQKYYWRGFCSPVGSRGHTVMFERPRVYRGRPHRFSGPYMRSGKFRKF